VCIPPTNPVVSSYPVKGFSDSTSDSSSLERVITQGSFLGFLRRRRLLKSYIYIIYYTVRWAGNVQVTKAAPGGPSVRSKGALLHDNAVSLH
jgi:hypothetical protein